MGDYFFTNRWFADSEIKQNFPSLVSMLGSHNQLNLLEIGSFEGASSFYFADHLLLNPESRLTCVDPFDLGDKTTPLTTSTEFIFLNNLEKCKHKHQIHVKKMMSDAFFASNQDTFDFIYLDGSHELHAIRNDFHNSLKVLKPNGILWMDDYGAKHLGINVCVDELYEENKAHLRILYKGGWQIAFVKTADKN